MPFVELDRYVAETQVTQPLLVVRQAQQGGSLLSKNQLTVYGKARSKQLPIFNGILSRTLRALKVIQNLRCNASAQRQCDAIKIACQCE